MSPVSIDDLPTDPALAIRFEHRMSDSDALMWAIEKDPMLRSTITSVVTVEGPVDREALWAQYERATRAIPRLRQRVRSNPMSVAPPRWEIDPNFDLGYHLRFARATGTGSMRDLLAMAEPIAMQGFDRARPLWETTVVEDLEGGNSAVIMKIHHAITDGVGGVKLMLEIFDLEPAPAPRLPLDAPYPHVMNQAERFIDAFQHETRRQLGIAKRAASTAVASVTTAIGDPVGTAGSAAELADSLLRILRPTAAPLSPLMVDRSLSNHFSTVSVPLDRAKLAGKLIGGTINDTFVSGIVLALARYHESRGCHLDTLRMGMPINIRTSDAAETAGNAFVPARFEVPAAADDPLALMTELRARMVAARDEPANQLVEPLSNVLYRLPTTVVTGIFGSMMKGLDFQASNVPGSPIPLYLLGRRVTALIPFGPLAGAAANITLLSYENALNIGVNVDPSAIEDPVTFTRLLEEAYTELLELA